jgi:hypothetical protein
MCQHDTMKRLSILIGCIAFFCPTASAFRVTFAPKASYQVKSKVAQSRKTCRRDRVFIKF